MPLRHVWHRRRGNFRFEWNPDRGFWRTRACPESHRYVGELLIGND